MSNQIKPEIYDKFQCINKECSMTCCKGWEISIDEDTFEHWDESLTQYTNTEEAVDGVTRHILAMDEEKGCPFLNKEGLCKVVMQYGEEHLSHTCHTFPRQCLSFDDHEERSLSCTCPAVVDQLGELNHTLRFTNEELIKQTSSEAELRQTLRDIMTDSTLAIELRLMLIQELLLLCVE